MPLLDITIETICTNFGKFQDDENAINREWRENWIMEKLKVKNVTCHMPLSHVSWNPPLIIWISNFHVDLGDRVYISIWSETKLLERFLFFHFLYWTPCMFRFIKRIHTRSTIVLGNSFTCIPYVPIGEWYPPYTFSMYSNFSVVDSDPNSDWFWV